MDEADRWFAQSETARASQGGVAVCVHLRRLQPAPNSEAEGRVCVKPGADAPAAAATAGSMASGDKISISTWRATRLQLAQPSFFRRLLEATDARNELTRLRGELDTVDSDRKVLKAKLDDKERLIDELSARLDALEKAGQTGGFIQTRDGSGRPGANQTHGQPIPQLNQPNGKLEPGEQKKPATIGARTGAGPAHG